MKESYVYKIYNPVTGLYSKGGSHSSLLWHKTGKTWRGIGPLKNHFHCCGRKILKEYAKDDCIIVEFLVKTEETDRTSLVEDLVKDTL
jgi:hypothetical protein